MFKMNDIVSALFSDNVERIGSITDIHLYNIQVKTASGTFWTVESMCRKATEEEIMGLPEHLRPPTDEQLTLRNRRLLAARMTMATLASLSK